MLSTSTVYSCTTIILIVFVDMCVCVLWLLSRNNNKQCSSSETVLIISCDLLWSVSAGVEVILRTTRVRMHGQQLQKIVLCCFFACTRVALNCNALGFMQAIFRTWLYNVLCALLLLCSTFLPHHDCVCTLVVSSTSAHTCSFLL